MKTDEYKPSIKKNVIFSFVAQVIGYISPLVVSPYISRVLGPSNLGIFSFCYSYAHYFVLFAAFGFADLGSKLISSRRADLSNRNKCFWSIVFSRLFFVFVSSTVYIALIELSAFGKLDDSRVMLVFLLLILSTAFDITFFFRGIEKITYIFSTTAVVNLIYVASVFVFVKSSDDLLLYTFLKTLSLCLVYFSLWFFSFKRIGRPYFSFKEIMSTSIEAAKFFLPTVVMSVGDSLDKTLIGLFSNTVQVGFYEQTFKVATLLSSTVSAISPVILSRISILKSEGSAEEIKNLASKSLILAIVLLAPLVSGLYIIGTDFVILFFGADFSDAVSVLFWLLPVAFISALTSILISSFYYPFGKTWIVSSVIFASIILNVSVSIALLKLTTLGASAAAIGTMVANAFAFCLLLIFARNIIDFKTILKDVLKVIGSLFVMCVPLVLLNHFVFRNLITNTLLKICLDILIGGFLYFFASILFKEKFVIEHVNRLIKRRRT